MRGVLVVLQGSANSGLSAVHCATGGGTRRCALAISMQRKWFTEACRGARSRPTTSQTCTDSRQPTGQQARDFASQARSGVELASFSRRGAPQLHRAPRRSTCGAPHVRCSAARSTHHGCTRHARGPALRAVVPRTRTREPANAVCRSGTGFGVRVRVYRLRDGAYGSVMATPHLAP